MLRSVREALIGALRILGYLLASPLLRRRYNRQGATPTERTMSLPGDDLVADPELGYTRAVTIHASPAEVWPWLVQIGQGRGGFYSYDGLENLVGCGIHSADDILDEHQRLYVHDIVRSGPDSFPCWVVTDVEPDDHLVLIGAGTPAAIEIPDVVEDVPAEGYVASTWQWLLRPDANGTRLLVRQRLTCSANQRRMWRLVEPIHFVMEHEMLRGLKARAEAASSAGAVA